MIEMHRLFVGLRPPPAIRAMLTATMTGVENARWQDDEQLHITLRFIGDVDGRMAEDIALTLGSIAVPPPEIAIDGVGSFDSRGRANAIWAGVSPRAPLAHLHRKVDQALVRLGLPPEGRAYLPHVTLARLNGSAGPVAPWLAVHAGLASPAFVTTHMYLFESRLGRAGASYEVVTRYPLA